MQKHGVRGIACYYDMKISIGRFRVVTCKMPLVSVVLAGARGIFITMEGWKGIDDREAFCIQQSLA